MVRGCDRNLIGRIEILHQIAIFDGHLPMELIVSWRLYFRHLQELVLDAGE